MKNIYIIPTDKPSRLAILHDDKLHIGTSFKLDINVKPQSIYITSDEEIKEGYAYYPELNEVLLFDDKQGEVYEKGRQLKVILTTDQDLIKDGVPAIDDTFLEWFVKNPSCEEVEIRKEMYMPQSNGKISDGKITHEISLDSSQNTLPYYKIIIPKEEQKQHLIDIMRGDEELGLYEEPKQETVNMNKNTHYVDFSNPNADKISSASTTTIKQETLEEAAESCVKNEPDELLKLIIKYSFKEGAKWQQERMYSEGDLEEAFKSGFTNCYNNDNLTFGEWFEQFKKK